MVEKTIEGTKNSQPLNFDSHANGHPKQYQWATCHGASATYSLFFLDAISCLQLPHLRCRLLKEHLDLHSTPVRCSSNGT